VLVGLWIRLTITESPLFREVEEHDAKVKAPIVDVLRRYPSRVLLAIGARIGVDVAFYTFVLFVTTYVAAYGGLPSTYALNAVLIAAAVQVFLIPWFGVLSDRFGRRPVYLFGAVGAGICVWVFFALRHLGGRLLPRGGGPRPHRGLHAPGAGDLADRPARRAGHRGSMTPENR
jgi:MFS family permease